MTDVLVTDDGCCMLFRMVEYSWDCRDFAVYPVITALLCYRALFVFSFKSHTPSGKPSLFFACSAAEPHHPSSLSRARPGLGSVAASTSCLHHSLPWLHNCLGHVTHDKA